MNIELLNIENMTFYDLIKIEFNGNDSISFIFYTLYPYKENPYGYYILEIKNVISLEMINNDPDKLNNDKNTPLDLSIQETFINGYQFYKIDIFANQEFAIIAKNINCYHVQNQKTLLHQDLSKNLITNNEPLDINSFNTLYFYVDKVIFDEIYNAHFKLSTNNINLHYLLEIGNIIEIKITNPILNNTNDNFIKKININKIPYIKKIHDTFYNRLYCQRNIYYKIDFNFNFNKNISFIAKKLNSFTYT